METGAGACLRDTPRRQMHVDSTLAYRIGAVLGPLGKYVHALAPYSDHSKIRSRNQPSTPETVRSIQAGPPAAFTGKALGMRRHGAHNQESNQKRKTLVSGKR